MRNEVAFSHPRESSPFAASLPSEFALIGFNGAPFGMSLTSAKARDFGRYVFVNPAYCEITGYRYEQLRTRTFHSVVHPDDIATVVESCAQLVSSVSRSVDAELRLMRSDGSVLWVRQHRSVIRDRAGEPLFFFTYTEDVTQRKTEKAAMLSVQGIAEEALRKSEARYRLLAQYAGDMIVRTRADRSREYVSPGSRTVLGYEPEELLETDFGDFLHPDDYGRVQSAYEQFLAVGDREVHHYRLRRKDDSYVWVEALWVAARDGSDESVLPHGRSVVAVVRDISERKAAEDKIAFMACHDPLTTLANRILLREGLENALRYAKRGGAAAVLSIDLDDFKTINDIFGHAAGDALLQEVARRLTQCVRETDTVARVGGDEFTIVQVQMESSDDAVVLAERILDVIAQPYKVDGCNVAVGASIGIATVPRGGLDYDQLLRNADLALYRAKAEGRRTYRLFEPQMDAIEHARRKLEIELRQAVAARAFRLFYQPIVNLRSEQIVCLEAFARWGHATRGIVSPVAFIPVAERIGLIVPLGEWLLREACREAARWPAHVKLAVNLSPIQLRNRGFVQTVIGALQACGLPARRLELEITESMLLQDNDVVITALHQLRDLGVSISFDDFGTGYSSLGYLRSFPFDKVKMAHSFIQDLVQSAESAAIVHAVIGLGTSLGFATVAEGVETSEQLEWLRRDGCTEAQGFFFSPPRPADELLFLCDENSVRDRTDLNF